MKNPQLHRVVLAEMLSPIATMISLSDLYGAFLTVGRKLPTNITPEMCQLDVKLPVRTMTTFQAIRLTDLAGELLVRKYASGMTKKQLKIIDWKTKYYDKYRIVVLNDLAVIDGTNHIFAGIYSEKPIKYIDLKDLPPTNGEVD